jgi:Uma2 family endonuclease
METVSMLAEEAHLGTTISDYEIERGKPMPSKLHSVIQINIGSAIKMRYKSRYRVMSELSVRLHGNKYVPDIVVYSQDASNWHIEEIEMTTPPLLAIEIESPSQATDEMKAKADKYLAAGVRSVWLVMPALGGIMVLQSEKKARFFSEGNVVDEELGIEIPIDEVFE